MKFTTTLLIGVCCLLSLGTVNSNAQSVKIFGSNSLNGAINGVVLGGATMFVTDKKVNAPFNKNLEDLYALQVGLGIGTLYGVSMGAYDVVTGEGRQILVSGFFNDGDNSSIIALMDTFYGAAAGGIIALSVSLVSNDPIIEAMQYGIGYGAFIGFGFGLVDMFMIAERSTQPIAFGNSGPTLAPGIASIDFENGNSIGFVNPTLTNIIQFDAASLKLNTQPTLEVFNLRMEF
jgi:hypothetical protein